MDRQRWGSVAAVVLTVVVLVNAGRLAYDYYAAGTPTQGYPAVVADTDEPTPSAPSNGSTEASHGATGSVSPGPGGGLAGQLDLPDSPTVVFIGDGATSGDGADAKHGYAPQVAAALGWSATVVPGGRGSGYVTDQGNGTFADRLEAARGKNAVSLVIVAGSEADTNSSADPAAVAAALPEVLSDVESTYGAAKVLVIGPYPTSEPPSGSETAIDEALARAAASADVHYLSPIQAGWFGDDPTAFIATGLLDQAGHDQYAKSLAAALS